MTASVQQIGAIHAIKNRLGLDDAVYRTILRDETGKDSAKHLERSEAVRVIDRLKGLQGSFNSPAKGAMQMSGAYIGKLRALWISGWNLGVVQDRSDRALCSFIERQTGISHPRFLIEASAAAKAIEGIKAWLEREAGVRWPKDSTDAVATKAAVVEAQANRLRRSGIDVLGLVDGRAANDLDHIAQVLGSKLRRALARKTEAAPCP